MISILLILYFLFLFPVLLGSLFIGKKEKEISICYLNGMVVSFAMFFVEAYLSDYFGCSLSRLASVYAITVGILSVLAVVRLIFQKSRFCLPAAYLCHYLAAGIVSAVFVVFRRDSAADSVLENALTHFALDRILGFSPYNGAELADAVNTGFVPAFYAVLSKLSGIHVTMIGKLLMPFAVVVMALTAYRLLVCRICGKDIRQSRRVLWGVLFLWIFLCFRGFPGYRVLWEAPWTPECLIWLCFLPFVIYLFSKGKWEGGFSVLFAASIIGIGFAADSWIFKCILRMLPGLMLLVLLAGILEMLPTRLWERVKKDLVKKKVFRISLSITVIAFAVLSIIFSGCMITDSTYEIPNNPYKMSREVMQIRMMLENMEQVKMIAPPEVAAQIRDGDLKVSLLFGADMERTSDTPEQNRLKGIAEDLALNEYEPLKLIQHSMAEGYNVVVAYRRQGNETAQEEVFFEYGFSQKGETKDYVVYEFIGNEFTAPNAVVIK